ncbi:glycosyltransferase family A protein [Flavobacterium sharifuzzamanii]|uniref:glycosyltransferase family A protein n=1 Tax=Flavobacterium sharifuzzamanii TaxID=2211133 RepID=UPI000DAC6952|nr:glycosyltransferase family A protein [Flavobacterium sharifuzzamanii]KAF2081182.1 glycosyltransferase family 2 protein [Flavobacterium sharifuzzamanii]
MRVGFNPNKDKRQKKNDFFHQIIVPVYIPNHEGYFRDSFKILKYCLESLFKTSHNKTYFTIVNNGSCQEVVDYLEELRKENKIHEVVHTTAIGKLNAILKGLVGHKFDLITITDADVLFLNNWQKATYEVFDAFKKAGAVGSTPSSKVLKQYTSNVIIENIFSSDLKFTKVLNPDAMKKFANSIGNANFYNDNHLKKNLTISSQNIRAIIGAGHFVATYRGQIFEHLKTKYTSYSLGGDSETYILDQPVEEKGYWRLTTEANYTYHMGNVFEEWMNDFYVLLVQEADEINVPINSAYKPKTYFDRFTKSLFKIMIKKTFWKLFLRYKGLTKKEAQNY